MHNGPPYPCGSVASDAIPGGGKGVTFGSSIVNFRESSANPCELSRESAVNSCMGMVMSPIQGSGVARIRYVDEDNRSGGTAEQLIRMGPVSERRVEQGMMEEDGHAPAPPGDQGEK